MPSARADVLVPAPDTDVTDAGVCRTPTGRVAPMILAHTTGPLSAGETPTPGPLDTQTLYIADGPPGVGVLCHGTTVAGPPAVRAIAPAPGAVAYLVADNDFGVWGAVGPGVARVDLTLQGYPWGCSFRIDSPSATTDLRDLGDGWHAFNTDVGFSPTPPATATAYDDAGHELGTRTVRRHG